MERPESSSLSLPLLAVPRRDVTLLLPCSSAKQWVGLWLGWVESL
nr:MAG TPA: hypothetical protein [Caudoviricetes sp.]